MQSCKTVKESVEPVKIEVSADSSSMHELARILLGDVAFDINKGKNNVIIASLHTNLRLDFDEDLITVVLKPKKNR